jgi:hypothetical protein
MSFRRKGLRSPVEELDRVIDVDLVIDALTIISRSILQAAGKQSGGGDNGMRRLLIPSNALGPLALEALSSILHSEIVP